MRKHPSRLLKFVEIDSEGEGPIRIAYALGSSKLPRPRNGLKWKLLGSFKVREVRLWDPRLKDVLERAIERGCAIVLLD